MSFDTNNDLEFTPGSIRRLVVVGGGSTGWMTAAMLALALPSECRVTVVRPQGDEGIGVGEATIPSILRLLDWFQIEEFDWMRRCHATYKLGIRFNDWHVPGHDWWHPFGVCGARIDDADLFHDWWVQRNRHGLDRSYTSYSIHWAAALAAKGPHLISGMSPIAQTKSYAFHLSATGLAEWLREEALKYGAEEVIGRVTDVVLSEDDVIEKLVIDKTTIVGGDFFLDCSGFQALLMSKTLKDPFLDWSSRLLCDRAVVTATTPRGTASPFTESRALSAGWRWRIPLVSRVGSGYVYSGKYQSDEGAWDELRQSLGADGPHAAEPRYLQMRIGRQSSFWRGNVLAIGLAAGFIEPLESTGLHLTQVGIEWFIDHFPGSAKRSAHANVYNRLMGSLYDEIADFVHLHYLASNRTDTLFWNDARNTTPSKALADRLATYSEVGRLGPLLADGFTETSYYHLLMGNGRLPRGVSAVSMAKPSPRIQQVLRAIDEQNRGLVERLPLHEEHLQWIHLGGN
jgi:tryptophan halogenase